MSPPGRRLITVDTYPPFTLTDAGALTAILNAVARKATVARLNTEGTFCEYGTARYIGALATGVTGRGRVATHLSDVRELFLWVLRPSGREEAWAIRNLIAGYRTGKFIADFDLAAFEAAGGQAAVPASVAAWKAAQGGATPDAQAPVRAEDLEFGKLVEIPAGPARGTKRWIPFIFQYAENSGAHVLTVNNAVHVAVPVAGLRRIDPGLLSQARSWAADCEWAEDADDIADLSDAQIVAGVQRHYVGGWDAFREASA
jgi:hypothetical protein